MRRAVAAVVLAVLASLLHAAAPAQAGVPQPIVGQLRLAVGGPVAGTTVRLHVDDGGEPGAVVDTVVTDDNGEFSLAPEIGGPHWVEVVRNRRVQGGYVGTGAGPSYVQFDQEFADPVTHGARLGRVFATPSFIAGVVTNAANGNRVRGIAVSVRKADQLGVSVGNDTTDARGRFRIPVHGEDFGLRVNGRARGYENGWLACRLRVVPTWGEACGVGPGRISRPIRLDRR